MPDKEKLKKISLFASLLFNQTEIALLLKTEDDIKDEDEAFKFGVISSKFNIRKALYTEAKKGSVAALKEWDMLEHKLKNSRGGRR